MGCVQLLSDLADCTLWSVIEPHNRLPSAVRNKVKVKSSKYVTYHYSLYHSDLSCFLSPGSNLSQHPILFTFYFKLYPLSLNCHPHENGDLMELSELLL